MFGWFKRLTVVWNARKCQKTGNSHLQTFILEPILTPSGFLDSGDDFLDLPLPESIDDPFPALEASALDLVNLDRANLEPPDLESLAPESFSEIAEIAPAEADLETLPFITPLEGISFAPAIESNTALALPESESLFNSGVFTVGDSGQVSIDFLFDGGAYKGELALFNLDGLARFDLTDADDLQDFIQEAAYRALQNDADSGYIVISDRSEGARFSGLLGERRDWNAGNYQGVKTFKLDPGDEFGLMLVPNGTLQEIYANPDLGGTRRPLFSLGTANPNDAFHLGQIADIYGNEQIFVMEDVRVDGRSDGDYNDLIFSIAGTHSDIIDLDDLIDPAADWRQTDPLLDPIAPDPLPLDPDSGTAYKPGELLVKVNPTASAADLNNLAQFHDASSVERLIPFDPGSDSSLQHWHTLTFDPDTDLLQLRDDLTADPFIDASSLNYARDIAAEPNDPDFYRLWGLDNTGARNQGNGEPDADIDAPEAWDLQTGSDDVIVAVIDTGIDYDHVDLAANIWANPDEIPGDNIDNDGNGMIDDVHGFDFGNSEDVNGDGDYLDPGDYNDANPNEEGYTRKYGHGTHVAGIIGAVGNNNTGVIGVSPNVSLMALNIHDRQTDTLWLDDITRAIHYAVDKDADIINASFGGWGFSSLEYDAIRTANAAGVLVVAAAGNRRDNNDDPNFAIYPASYDLPNLISVAATTQFDSLSWFSNYGATTVDLGAPGGGIEDIYSTVPNDGYRYKRGTSMAAPHVAGAAALLLAQEPNLSHHTLKRILLDTVDPLDDLSDTTVSGGRLNLHQALQQAIGEVENTDYRFNWVNTTFGEDFNLAGDSIRLTSTPKSDAARDAFLTNLTDVETEDFDSFADGIVPNTLTFGDVTATISGNPSIRQVAAGTDGGRFPLSGDNFLFSYGEQEFRLDFSSPQNAFGFSATDVEAGQFNLTLHRADGSSTDLNIPYTAFYPDYTGSALYFSVTDTDVPFTGITIATTEATEGIGYDNFTIGQLKPDYDNSSPIPPNQTIHQPYREDEPLDLVDIRITDPDGETTVTLTLSDPAAGRLTTGTVGSVTSSFSNGIWRASGNVTDINTLLEAVEFIPAADYSRNLNIALNISDDLGYPLTGTIALKALVENDAPTLQIEPTQQWTRQLGTTGYDSSQDIAVDSNGNLFLVGFVRGELDGHPYAGRPAVPGGRGDAFITKYDASGNKLWTDVLGTAEDDGFEGVAVDSEGNAYVVGQSHDSLNGNVHAGSSDGFFAKYNPEGTLLWSRQIGTDGHDTLKKIVSDNKDNFYTVGHTEGLLDGTTSHTGVDALIVKWDSDGNPLWTRQLTSTAWSGSTANDVAFDPVTGDIIITGFVTGSLNGETSTGDHDAFVARYDSKGTLLWNRQLGSTGWDAASAIELDSDGNIYISGVVPESLNGDPAFGERDFFVAKYDREGNLSWTEQLGTTGHDIAYGIEVDSNGQVYMSGHVGGSLDGNEHSGTIDAFLTGFDTHGNRGWSEQFGSPGWDWLNQMTLDEDNNLYISGGISDSLNGDTHVGSLDPFIAKYALAQTYTENTPLALSDIAINDADVGATVTVTLTLSDADAGVLTSGTTNAATVSFEDGVWQASGSVAAVNALLADLWFVPSSGYLDEVTISTTVSDGIADAVSGGTLTLTGVEAPPKFFNPEGAYLSFDDSPFKDESFAYFHLETFEDGAFNSPGVSVSGGGLRTPAGGLTDSVDGDDGAIDGSGSDGHSWHSDGAASMRFTFDEAELGSLPTHAGIVFTDLSSPGELIFEAFDAEGQSLGQIGPVDVGDDSSAGTTAEDRFFGVAHSDGISAIELTTDASQLDLEVDHLQYGLANLPTLEIEATDAEASESGNAGQFVLSRTGNTDQPLTVRYALAGDATPDRDYQTLSGSITIPVGASKVTLPVVPLRDYQSEGNETVEISLMTDSAYRTGSNSSASVSLSDETVTADYGPFLYVNPANGHQYILSQPDTWLGAQEQAVALGGNLVTVNDAAENDWVIETFGREDFWLGFTDSAIYDREEGNYQWISGEPVSYTNWIPGEPNNLGDEGQDFAVANLAVGGAWDDITTDSNFWIRRGVIEIDPATLAQPIVNVAVTDAIAGEDGDAGQLLISRTGDLSQALTVNYTVAGDTVNGSDYQALSGSVTIPVGAALVTLPILPLADNVAEQPETLILDLAAGDYAIGTRATAQLTLEDSAPFSSPIYTHPDTGNRYIFTAQDSWLGAQEQAAALGGNLVTINDATEKDWLVDTLGGAVAFWIGFTDSEIYGATENNYRWVSGEPVDYTNWYPLEPDNVLHTLEGEDFVHLNFQSSVFPEQGYWNDLPYDFGQLSGIVEVEAGAIPNSSGLVFLKSADAEISHVGLLFEGTVYEASGGYASGNYWDEVTKDYRTITAESGVQKQHSIGSFIHQSQTPTASPVLSYEFVALPEQQAQAMADAIESNWLDAGYFLDPFCHSTPSEQKGLTGSFTSTGLIERAAEEAGINGGQGFVPDHHESIRVLGNTECLYQSLDPVDDLPSTSPGETTSDPSGPIPISPLTSFSNMSPSRLYSFVSKVPTTDG